MLEARDLHKVYREGAREVYAVRGANLTIQRGEILAIVGPSGAGKSTLLHLLGGLDKPSSGSVTLDGKDIYKITDKARSRIRNERVGFVFQFYHLLPELTALENVMLPALVKRGSRGAKEIRARAEELLDIVELGERVTHKPSQLSGGEAQRVAIARALVNDPDMVFCDEPTGNLDSRMSGDIRGLIARLRSAKKQTFVIVTHEEPLAKEADRVLFIKDGKVGAQ